MILPSSEPQRSHAVPTLFYRWPLDLSDSLNVPDYVRHMHTVDLSDPTCGDAADAQRYVESVPLASQNYMQSCQVLPERACGGHY